MQWHRGHGNTLITYATRIRISLIELNTRHKNGFFISLSLDRGSSYSSYHYGAVAKKRGDIKGVSGTNWNHNYVSVSSDTFLYS